MKVKIVPTAFKQHFAEPEVAQGVDPEVVSSYMKTFYGNEATTYPAPPYATVEKQDQAVKANEEALAICNKMQTLGFSNFSGLKSKFKDKPENEFEANQRDLIKKTMEGILCTFEKSVAPPKDVLVAQYKDRQFVCADGTLTNLQSILADLSLGNQGISAYVTQQGREFVTQTATEMHQKNQFPEFVGTYRSAMWEIHVISSLVNSVASEYGIKAKKAEEDHYLSSVPTHRTSSEKLSNALEQGLQNEATVNNFMEGIARNVVFGLPTYTEGKYKNPNEFNQEVADSIARLNIGDIINTAALVKLENYQPTGYKPNIESILKDVTTIFLNEKGVLQIPEKDLELTKLRIDLEKAVDDMSSHNAITKEVLDAAQGKGNLEYAMKYAIDNKLTLDEDSLGTADPMKYAIDNNIKIDGIDPKQYAIDNDIKIDGVDPKQYTLKFIVDQYIKADEQARPRLEEEFKSLIKKIETEVHPNRSKQDAKQYVLEEIIEEYLKTDDPELQKDLKEKYATMQKLVEEKESHGSKKTVKQYILEEIIEEYLKTDDPKLRINLKTKYNTIQQLVAEEGSQVLTMESNLGQFLNNPKAPEILANHKDFKGKSALKTDVDYTKCDLDVITKCKEVHEKTSKARDYDSLSTIQKVGVAFATIVPIIGNVVAYYAMKSHNKSEKAKLESTIGASLDGIKGDLETLSKKSKLEIFQNIKKETIQEAQELFSRHEADKKPSALPNNAKSGITTRGV